MQEESVASRARWLWYALIGVCLASLLFVWGFYFQIHPNPNYDKWIKFGIYTAIVFGILAKWAWHYRKATRFWFLLAGLLLAHCVFFSAFSIFFSHGLLSNLTLGLVGSAEIMTLASIIALAMKARW